MQVEAPMDAVSIENVLLCHCCCCIVWKKAALSFLVTGMCLSLHDVCPTLGNLNCVFAPVVAERAQLAAFYLCLDWLLFREARLHSATYMPKENHAHSDSTGATLFHEDVGKHMETHVNAEWVSPISLQFLTNVYSFNGNKSVKKRNGCGDHLL